MTGPLALLCFIVALVLFLLAAFNVGAPRVNLLCLGLAAFTVPFVLVAAHIG
jgi:hypothetical protein